MPPPRKGGEAAAAASGGGGGGGRGRGGGRGQGGRGGRGQGGRGGRGGRRPAANRRPAFAPGSAIPAELLQDIDANGARRLGSRRTLSSSPSFCSPPVSPSRGNKQGARTATTGPLRGSAWEPSGHGEKNGRQRNFARSVRRRRKSDDVGADSPAPPASKKVKASEESTCVAQAASTPKEKKCEQPSSAKTVLERLAKKNPEYYALLESERLVRPLSGAGADDREEKELRSLEKKLGMKKGAALSKKFKEDGLSFLLDGLDFGSRALKAKAGRGQDNIDQDLADESDATDM
ncbi:MAG: hypothetical protein BJ554DRAFT_570, partial [Olpidium bornovanus]